MVVEVDTIAAIATAIGEASVGIVRLSGRNAREIALRMFRTPSGKVVELLPARAFLYGNVVHPVNQSIVDEGYLLWIPGPRSYTAEDIVELHVHGGVRVVHAVLEAALLAGARLAEPGEFTKRAFLNGRIDLSQAEAVIDLIRSKTDLAAKSALSQVKGHFRDEIVRLRQSLLSLQAHVEVTIDYPEHDVEQIACQQVIQVGGSILSSVDQLLSFSRVGRILREGVLTVIAGRPNVGKSSLLNALLRRERAIVTDIPGTTRDVIEEYVSVRGIPLRLIDTAGLRETADLVEQIGVEKSREMLAGAELTLVVLNGSEPLQSEDIALLNETAEATRLVIVNKSDLPRHSDVVQWMRDVPDSHVIEVSARLSKGLGELEDRVADLLLGESRHVADSAYLTNARQTQLLAEAKLDLETAIEAAKAGATLDLIAVQLQAVYVELGHVIGEEAGEDLLDEIFSKFCLGK